MNTFHRIARATPGLLLVASFLPALAPAAEPQVQKVTVKAEKTALVTTMQPRIEKDEQATLRTVCLEGSDLWMQRQLDLDRMGNDGPLHACYKVIVKATAPEPK